MNDPLYDWALRAAQLRFGPHVSLRKEEDGSAVDCVAYLEVPGEPRRLLARSRNWPDTMTEAVKANPDIPQPPPAPMGPETAPVGDEFIEEFVGAMRRRDLFTEFLLWYGEKADKNPDSYPRALHRGEWLEQLGAFIGGVEE